MLFLYGFIPVLIAIILYVLSSDAEKKEKEKKEKRRERTFYVKDIKKRYPDAFETYWNKADLANSVLKNYSSIRVGESSYEWPYKIWDILERDIQQKRDDEQQKKLNDLFSELKRNEEVLKETNPSAYESFKKRYPDITIEDIYNQNKVESFLKKRGNICP